MDLRGWVSCLVEMSKSFPQDPCMVCIYVFLRNYLLPYHTNQLNAGNIYQSHGSVMGYVCPHGDLQLAVRFHHGAFQVLDSFDAMVRCISQASRLQVQRNNRCGTLGWWNNVEMSSVEGPLVGCLI